MILCLVFLYLDIRRNPQDHENRDLKFPLRTSIVNLK